MSVKRAISKIQKLYPVAYSETAWDNTGLLLDAASTATESSPLRILLTIDLTQRVLQEAISKEVKLIVAYHPFLFKKFNKVEPSSVPQHDSLIKLIRNDISVYSPHTAVDSVRYGVNDWIVEGLANESAIESVSVISPNKTNPDVGCGRVVCLKEPVPLDSLIHGLKAHLGVENLLIGSIAKDYSKVLVSTIAVCAGSGSGVFSSVDAAQIDLYVTGELSHHEGLSLKELGKVVLLANHSNTERGYLRRMRSLLLRELNESENDDIEILISEHDEDTYAFI